MPSYFETGFMVNEPAWHGLGTVLDHYPGREEGMKLAGHDFELEECYSFTGPALQYDKNGSLYPCDPSVDGLKQDTGWRSVVKRMDGDPSNGKLFHKVKDSFGTIPNRIGWDLCDAIVGQGAKYESAGVLKGGASCWILAWLDEPVTIYGDDSVTLPFCNIAWHHDGSGALTTRSTDVRVVCANTQSAAEMQASRLGVDFTFRHTKNVMEQVENAKLAIQGIRTGHEDFIEMANVMAKTKITKAKRELFISQFIPMPPEALISDRVLNNVESARGEVRILFNGPTIPEAHRFTAYGLHLAGVEYLDHVRRSNNLETKFRRCILRNEPMKAKLHKLIEEVVAS